MIKKRYMAFIMACFFAAMTCALPVEAASTQDTKKNSQSNVAKKSNKSAKPDKVASAKSASSTKKSPAASASKKSAVTSGSKKSAAKKTTAAKSTAKKSTSKKAPKKKNSAKRAEAAPSTNSQQIWMERAAKSDMQTGIASWYGGKLHGGQTASGESYDMHMFTAAHRTLPLGTVVKVTDEKSGDSVMVCINDRGPYIRGRVIDLSYAAAEQLGLDSRGVAEVAVEVVSNAEGNPLNEDEAFFVDLVGDDASGKDFIGPFRQFADASVMQEVLREQHPKAAVVVRPIASK